MTTPSMSASFIIPFYNNGATLPETIASVRSQTYTDYDIWIIDDGSTDESSLAVLDTYKGQPGITVLHQANAGPSVARNLAISQTRAAIIVPLDSDDLIRPDALAWAANILMRDPTVDVVYSDLQLFGAQNERKVSGEPDVRSILMYNYIAACTFIRRELFDTIGLYDEYLSKLGLEDWELWIRAMGQGRSFHYHPEIMFDIRVRENSRTYTQANKNLALLKKYIYGKHVDILSEQYAALFYHKRYLEGSLPFRVKESLAGPYRAFWRKMKGK